MHNEEKDDFFARENMTYQLLENFSKYWVFQREDPKISPEDLAQIRLLSEKRAGQIWHDYVSPVHLHPDHFSSTDWPNDKTLKMNSVPWEPEWEGDAPALPSAILEHVSHWGEDTQVFFCCHSELVFELTWGVFKRTWKAFLFLDNGPLLIGRKKKQAVQFYSTGMAHLLVRQ